MGTSKGYGGSPDGLVPSWVDSTAPGAAASSGPPGDGNRDPNSPPSLPPQIPARAPDTSSAGVLSAAKGNFTRFVRSGDSSALQRAVSQYVRNGAGSARKAARRMGASRGVGSRMLQAIRDINNEGANAVLRKLSLDHLVGRPATDVFVSLMEAICPPGGRIDEAIARQALLDAIADLVDADVGSIDEMSPAQLSEFFLDFVIHTIEGRVIADIGTHAIDLPESEEGVERIQEQLHDFVDGCVRGHLGQHLDGLTEKTDQQVNDIVERIYEAAFELVSATAGDME